VIVLFCSGATTTGSQTCAGGAAGKLYPARMRTTGMAWANGVGRLGAVAAPVLAGYLLSIGLPPRHIFLSACDFAVVAAAACWLLRFRGMQAVPVIAEVGRS
jgi:MFS family permease